jgi:branched-chain amino acid transport system permease protein
LPLGLILEGLIKGALAGMNSLGLVLLWRTTRLVNIAQPAMGLIGGVSVGLLVVSAGWSFWWAAPFGIILGALLGFATDRVILRKIREAPRAAMLVVTVGLAIMFSSIQFGLPLAFLGHALQIYPISIGNLSFNLGTYRFAGPEIAVMILFPLSLGGILFFVYRTRFGLAALALGQDAERARSLGVSSSVVRSLVWAVAGVLATVSAMLSIDIVGSNLSGGLGPVTLLLALAPAVFAGFRSFVGAAAGALALGVAYEVALRHSDRGNFGNLVFAVAVVLAVALQRNRLGRAEAATRASSWGAAASVRPLPWAVVTSPMFQLLSTSLVFALALGGAVIPYVIDKQVLYAADASLALCVVAIGAAWVYAGEIALGHWGIAGLGGAVAAYLPGPWPLRALFATVAMAAVGAVMGLVARRQSSLSYAVLGLAAAAAAPVAITSLGANHHMPTDPRTAGVVTTVVVVLAVAGLTRLRRTTVGARMVAARDDPARAPWLGANPLTARMLALAISAGLAGLAGALYLVSTPFYLESAFSPIRSLELLSWAVVGGLGSPAGALVGAVVVMFAGSVLPQPWHDLAPGLGVLLVVIFRPTGLSRLLEWMRDRIVRALPVETPRAPAPAAPTPRAEVPA